jgi:hypothetical protein
MKLYKALELLRKIGYKILPVVNEQNYVYKESELVTPEFEISIEEERQDDGIYIYGWVIQQNYRNIRDDKKDSWSQHWKNKIYLSKSSAIDALNQYRLYSAGLHTDDFRIKPLYSFDKNSWRNYMISKIICEK